MKGADTVARDLIRSAVGKIFDRAFPGVESQQIEQWFNLGGAIKLDDNQPAAAALADLKQIQGLIAKLAPIGVKASDPAPVVVAAAEFFLEGLVAHRKISRSEERVFSGQPKPQSRKQEAAADLEIDYEEWQRARRTPRGGLN